jgi:hypothetical protein
MSDQRQYTCIHIRDLKAGGTAYAQATPHITYYEQPTNESITIIRLKGPK